MEIRKNIILAPYTTFRIGGPARYFCEVSNVEDLKIALQFSKENNLRFFVLGGGSNILVSEEGFNGLVIKMGIKGLEFNGELLSIGAGEDWDYVVGQAVKKNLGGIENLSLIPGTTGAAVYGNIGAYGVELKDVLESTKVLDISLGEIKTISNKDCKFEYRDSVFKHKEGANFIILGVNIILSKNHEPKIGYPDLVKIFDNEKPSILDVRNEIIKIRKNKLPYPTEIPGWAKAPPQEPSPRDEIGNAGSFFKNPIVTEERYDKLKQRYPDLKSFKLETRMVKLSAAQLIEKCGWKGKRLGNVGVSEKHSLVLVSYGGGNGAKVKEIAVNIIKDVKEKFSVALEPEVLIISHF